MTQPLPRFLPWLVLSLLLVAGAFQWGSAQAGSSASLVDRRRSAVVEAVQHVAPAVVNVEAVLNYGRGYIGRSSGAGVIVHPDGYLVTNSHVIRGASQIWVERFGGRSRIEARRVADEPSGDLALLKVTTSGRMPYVSLCPTRGLLLGETAIAIGNPHGLGDTVTVGVVSALGRSAKLSDGAVLSNLVQTDASINTGNSGGPLINLDGELIGINVSILPSAKGIAFAIGADQVEGILRRALGGGANPPRNALPDSSDPPAPSPGVSRPSPSPAPGPVRPPPWTPDAEDPPSSPGSGGGGALPAPRVSAPLRTGDFGFEVRDDGCRLLVTQVRPSSSAAIAGVREGDIVLSLDHTPVEGETDLLLAFSAAEPGRVYSLEVRRGADVKRLLLVTPR